MSSRHLVWFSVLLLAQSAASPAAAWCPERRGPGFQPDGAMCMSSFAASPKSFYTGPNCTGQEFVHGSIFSPYVLTTHDGGGQIGTTSHKKMIARSYRLGGQGCTNEPGYEDGQHYAKGYIVSYGAKVYRNNSYAQSCAGHCGWESAAEAGCRCDAECELTGTCCWDYQDVCTDEPITAARDKEVRNAANAAIGGVGDDDETRASSNILGHNPHMTRMAYGLTKVKFRELDTSTEISQCRIRRHRQIDANGTDAGTLVYVSALAKGDDNLADCGGGIYNARHNMNNAARYTAIRYKWQSDGATTVCMGGHQTKDVPVLTGVSFKRLGSAADKGSCKIAWNSSGGCGWELSAITSDNGEAWCEGMVTNLDPQNGFIGTATRAGSYASFTKTFPSNYYAWSEQSGGGPWTWDTMEQSGKREWECHGCEGNGNGHKPRFAEHTTPMATEVDHQCFLTQVGFSELDRGDENATCEIVNREGKWHLKSRVDGWDGETDVTADCRATCMRVASGDDAFPPRPTTIKLGASHWTTGTRAVLFQSGAYDRPLVFWEGFDPANRNGFTSNVAALHSGLQTMLSLGYDVWIGDTKEGGGPVLDLAKELVEVVDYAANVHAGGVSHDIPVLAASMGALGGRIAMARWEAGDYNPGGAAHFRRKNGQLIDPEPPVSNMIAFVGPQDGANIPKSAQIVIQDLNGRADIGEVALALNSPAAANMLNERIHPQCQDVVTDGCGPLYPFRDGITNVSGFECPVDYTGCLEWEFSGPTAPYGSTGYGECLRSALRSGLFYSQTDGYGDNENGYASSVSNIGIASGSFAPQSDHAFGDDPDGEFVCQWDGGDFVGCDDDYCFPCETEQNGACVTSDNRFGTELARISFHDIGHTIFNLCDRDTSVRMMLSQADLPGGDSSGRSLSAVAEQIVLTDKFNALGISQHFPFMFIPTRSALHCSNSNSEAECQAENEEAERFRKVHTSLFNIRHGSTDAKTEGLLLGYIVEGTVGMENVAGGSGGDGDGYFSVENPIYQAIRYASCGTSQSCDLVDGWFGPFDCDPDDDQVHPGAVERGDNTIDDNCDGHIATCGDGTCDPGEEDGVCLLDCLPGCVPNLKGPDDEPDPCDPICGDGVCHPGEYCADVYGGCEADCGCCWGTQCPLGKKKCRNYECVPCEHGSCSTSSECGQFLYCDTSIGCCTDGS